MRSWFLPSLIGATVAMALGAAFYFFYMRLSVPIVYVQDPVYGDTPILRLNPAQHSGSIFRAGITEDGRLLATAGSDNVVKIWRVDDLDHIRVVNTLRVPISNEAAVDSSAAGLRAVDISPGGRWVAAAGQTRADGTYRLLVLDAATGEIVRDLLNARGIINDVAFSRDGRSLAAGLYACEAHPVGTCTDPNNGLWVWSTANWDAAPYRDRAYQGRINGIAFNSAGDLFTTSLDHKLRRYGAAQLRTTGFAPTPVAARPFASDYDPDIRPYDLAVSPDGQTVLVGYLNDQDHDDPAALTLYRARDLAPLRDFDIGRLPADHGGLVQATVVNGVSFSGDGAYVYASIAQHQSGSADTVLRRWSVADANAHFADSGLCTSQNIIQVLPYQHHGAILVSSDPCVSAIDDAGRRVDVPRSVYPINNDNLGAIDPGLLLVSEHGDRFYLAGEHAGHGLAFDLSKRRLIQNPRARASARNGVSDGYRQASGGTTMSGWCCSGSAPLINGVSIRLGPTTVTWSTDVARNGDFAVLGTSTFLARYDRDGRQVWQYRAQVPRRVNITPDGRTVIALYRDGVMRWHSASDGRVLLNLFIDATGENWVMWTPAGYYDSSAGGDAILGWHLNNGRDAAPSWLPVGRYANVFRRPDLINHVVQYIRDGVVTRGFEAANSRQLADATIRGSAPPIVQIADARIMARGTQMLVTYTVSSPSSDPVTAVRIDVNGRPEAADERRVLPGERIQRVIPVNPRSDHYVGIRAVNQHGVGEVATVSVLDAYRNAAPNREGPSGTTPNPSEPLPPPAQRPVLYALVVGLDYTYGGHGRLPSLCCASNDAKEFAAFLRGQSRHAERSLYSDVNVVELSDADATLEALQANLSRLSRVGGNSVVLIFLAGHGVSDNSGRGNYYYIPYGIDPESAPLENIALTGARITQTLRDARAPVMLFLDTCNARGALERSFLNDVYNLQQNVLVFSSSRDGQASQERLQWGHGAFTRALLQAVHGDVPIPEGNGIVTYAELGPFLSERVKYMTGNQQSPQYFGWGPQGANPEFNMFSVGRRRGPAPALEVPVVGGQPTVRAVPASGMIAPGGDCSGRQVDCQPGWGGFAQPSDLWVGSTTRIQFSVAPDQAGVAEELDGAAAASMRQITLAERMQVRLLPDPNFEIVPLDPPSGEQPIGPDRRASWIWDVTPRGTDNRPYQLTAIVRALDQAGRQIESYPKHVTVTVRIGTWRGFINALQNARSAGDLVSAASRSWETAVVSITAVVTALAGLFVAIRALRPKSGRQRVAPAKESIRRQRRPKAARSGA